MIEATKIKSNKLYYEIFIATLALIAVTLTLLDIVGYIAIGSSIILATIDTGILTIFAIDYVTRLYLSKSKKKFVRENIFDLIAIIPFNSMFRVFRVFRMFRVLKITKLIRLVSLTAKVRDKTKTFLNTNGFIYILYITIFTVMLGAVGGYYAERNHSINSFGDALWWSFVTATTVGYGDISPTTTIGRIIAAILMVVGIGFIGMLTGTIATYFLAKKQPPKPHIDINTIDVSQLSMEEIIEVQRYVNFVISKKEKNAL